LNELNEIAKNWGIENKILDPYNKKRIVRALERHKFAPENNEAKNHVPQISPLIIGINVDVPLRRERITKRLHERLELGMVDEVRSLLEEGVSSEALIYYGLEYRYITQYLLGELAYDKMVELLNIAIHQFAKRQMTWYRRMEKMGFEINWIDGMWSKKDKLIATGMYLKSFFERNE
jgi:tRNA dimethylallyltransferase